MDYIINKFFFILSALFLIFLVFFFYYFPKESRSISLISECDGNETRSCVIGGCSGSQYCIAGKWSVCKVSTTCMPGEKVPCSENGCVNGYKICNSCGTGYSNCVATVS